MAQNSCDLGSSQVQAAFEIYATCFVPWIPLHRSRQTVEGLEGFSLPFPFHLETLLPFFNSSTSYPLYPYVRYSFESSLVLVPSCTRFSALLNHFTVSSAGALVSPLVFVLKSWLQKCEESSHLRETTVTN